MGTFIDFDWLVHLVECLNVSTTYSNLHKAWLWVSLLGMYINLSPLSYPCCLSLYLNLGQFCFCINFIIWSNQFLLARFRLELGEGRSSMVSLTFLPPNNIIQNIIDETKHISFFSAKTAFRDKTKYNKLMYTPSQMSTQPLLFYFNKH